MKLVCLNEHGWIGVENKDSNGGPSKGDLVTKIGEEARYGNVYYFLKEWTEEGSSYLSTCFLPINEQKNESEEHLKEIEFSEIKELNPLSAS